MSKYTGHREALIGGKTIAQHLRPVVDDEARRYGIASPSDKQIALVVSALRMHHTMVHAGNYDRSELGEPDKITTFYPIESSIGRFLRDSAQVVFDEGEDKR